MIPFAPLAAAGGVAALVASNARKPGRLIDALKSQQVDNQGLVRRLAQVPLINNSGAQQIANFLAPSGPRSEIEIQVSKELQGVTLGIALGIAGLVWYPLQLVGLFWLWPTIADALKDGYQSLVHQHRVNTSVLSATFVLGALAGGLFFELIIGGWFLVFVKWLAVKTEDHSKQGIIDLFGQQIRSVWMIVDGVEVEVPVEQVKSEDQIIIHAGQMVPMDGVIVEGHASIDQHMLTGEAQPAEKEPGDRVLAATIVLAGRILIAVENAGQETVAAQIGRVLTDTSDFKESLMSRADAFNDQMAGPFLALAGLSLPFIGMSRALGVLSGTPGYRMVVFGPLSMLSYLHLAAQQGILIKDGRSLELLQDVDTVVFDKTGTLTLDQPHVSAIHACDGFTEREVLIYAATAETKQSHPIARAILQAAAAKGITLTDIDSAEYEIGYGIEVHIQGRRIRVGSWRFMQMNEITIPKTIQALQDEVHDLGQSLVLVAIDDQLAGAIVLQTTLRPEATEIIAQLRARGLQLYIISGDHDAPTRRLADQLGMDGYFAEVLPEDKADLVKQLQVQGRNVCFIGDGINDSIALKSANVSVSLHGATTIAIDTAQIILMNGDLAQLPQLFTVADEFAANMRVNFYAASIPPIVILGGVYFLGWGLLTATILYQLSVPFALYNTMRPLLVQKGVQQLEQGNRPQQIAQSGPTA